MFTVLSFDYLLLSVIDVSGLRLIFEALAGWFESPLWVDPSNSPYLITVRKNFSYRFMIRDVS